ncbi:MAG: M28 family metallopeptidase [Lysobacter sp.]
MRSSHCLALAVSLALLSACAQSPKGSAATAGDANAVETAAPTPASDAAKAWLADVDAIATAADNAGRRRVIEQQLESLGLAWQAMPFESEHGPGENLIAKVSGNPEAPLLLLGAHSDRVGEGKGATDNASGSAVVLELAERFKQAPLDNHRVSVAFWDLEERGLLGAHAFIAKGGPAPAQYVNFDVFGWGDTVWMMTPDPAHPLTTASQAAANDAGLHLSAGEQYPPTDHRAFLKAGWPAVSYSLVGQDEIGAILAAYAGNKPEATPKVMHVIHSERDTLAQLDPNAAARGIDAIEAALRQWDAGAGSTNAAAASND